MLTVRELLAIDLGEIKRLDYDTGKVLERSGVTQRVGQKVEGDFAESEIADKPVFFIRLINDQKLTDYQLCEKLIQLNLGEHYKFRSYDKNPDDKLCTVTKLKLIDEEYIIKKKYPQLDQAQAVAFTQVDAKQFDTVPVIFELQYR